MTIQLIAERDALRRQVQKLTEQIETERIEKHAWEDTANFHLKNETFYRGIVARIGETFGDAAKTSDDGTVQKNVLALKVPELVARLHRWKEEALTCGLLPTDLYHTVIRIADWMRLGDSVFDALRRILKEYEVLRQPSE